MGIDKRLRAACLKVFACSAVHQQTYPALLNNRNTSHLSTYNVIINCRIWNIGGPRAFGITEVAEMTTFPGVSGVVLIQHKNTQYK